MKFGELRQHTRMPKMLISICKLHRQTAHTHTKTHTHTHIHIHTHDADAQGVAAMHFVHTHVLGSRARTPILFQPFSVSAETCSQTGLCWMIQCQRVLPRAFLGDSGDRAARTAVAELRAGRALPARSSPYTWSGHACRCQGLHHEGASAEDIQETGRYQGLYAWREKRAISSAGSSPMR